MKETLAALAQWKADGQLFISLSPPFTATLEVDRTVMADTLAHSALSAAEFKAASEEIGLILLNILNRTEALYVSGTVGGDAVAEVAQGRREAYVAEVKSRLYDAYLQRRYDLKKSSKAPSFNGVDWDVKVKRFDASSEEFQPFPYATLRLSFQRDFEDSAFSLLGGNVRLRSD